jgi:hypothetical protein
MLREIRIEVESNKNEDTRRRRRKKLQQRGLADKGSSGGGPTFIPAIARLTLKMVTVNELRNDLVEVFVAVHPRIVDPQNLHKALGELNVAINGYLPVDLVRSRLGHLACGLYNPLQPAGRYMMSLEQRDSRQLAALLCQLCENDPKVAAAAKIKLDGKDRKTLAVVDLPAEGKLTISIAPQPDAKAKVAADPSGRGAMVRKQQHLALCAAWGVEMRL